MTADELIDYIEQTIETMPSIDYEADPLDTSPEDAPAHVAGLIVQEIKRYRKEVGAA